MLSLALAVMAASLMGSVHCAAMCGAFTCLYTGTVPGAAARGTTFALHAAYNAGRLVSYAALGVVAGSIGVAVGRGAALVAGVLLVIWGVGEVVRARGGMRHRVRVPAPWQRAMGSVVLRVQARSQMTRATVTGLVTTLLPCGWMWAFAAVAGGTGSRAGATLVMTAFWAGTLPVMLAMGAGAQRLTGRLRTHLPVVSAAAIVILGLASIALHLGLLPGTSLLHGLVPDVPVGVPGAHVAGAH
jgi:sulfite exporter TauE/SafE